MDKSVLIIDDEPRITGALMIRLEAAGYKVYHAINGLAGVEAAAIHNPDLVVLDIRMPDIDGFETCERIRRLPALAGVPVVFLSANVQDEAKSRAVELECSAFISKPYQGAHVVETISSLIGHPAGGEVPHV